MFGAIIGDVQGSRFERKNCKNFNFKNFTSKSHFTDDTVMTIAVAKTMLKNEPIENDFKSNFLEYGNKYFDVGYGKAFRTWLKEDDPQPYNSWGNGSAMRVSPIGFIAKDIKDALYYSKLSAMPTHNHIEGIKGAQAVASVISLSRSGKNKKYIKTFIEYAFKYDLKRKYTDIIKDYKFQVSCQKSVPESIIIFLQSDSFEDAMHKAIMLGGDTDTIASMVGAMSQSYYKTIPKQWINKTLDRLPEDFIYIIKQFEQILEKEYRVLI